MLFQPTRKDVYFFFYECWHGEILMQHSAIHQLGIEVLKLHHQEAIEVFGDANPQKITDPNYLSDSSDSLKTNIWQQHQNQEQTSKNISDYSDCFRHWSLHLAVIEQVKANQPFGIIDEFYRLGNFYRDAHTNIDVLHSVYHHMMAVLSDILVQQLPPQMYLERLKNKDLNIKP
jgi:hypothetical protein